MILHFCPWATAPNETIDQQQKFVQDALSRINELLCAASLRVPACVKITGENFGQGAYSVFNHELLIPRLSNDRDTFAVLSHEYGHLIFETNLQLYLPARKELIALKNRLESCDQAQGKDRLDAVRAKFREQQKIVTKYSELFSDLLSVMTCLDPEIMAQVLSRHGNRKSPKYRFLALRGFSCFREDLWTDAPDSIQRDPHFIFHPSRCALYLGIQNQPEALRLSFQAFLEEVFEGIAAPSQHLTASVEALNQQLQARCAAH